jgi:GTPase KRas
MRDLIVSIGEGFLLLFDISETTPSQLKNLCEETLKMIYRVKDVDRYPVVLVGTKCDLEDERKISYKIAADLAKEFNIQFFETSSKIPINVDECYFALAEEIFKNQDFDSSVEKKQKECLLM